MLDCQRARGILIFLIVMYVVFLPISEALKNIFGNVLIVFYILFGDKLRFNEARIEAKLLLLVGLSAFLAGFSGEISVGMIRSAYQWATPFIIVYILISLRPSPTDVILIFRAILLGGCCALLDSFIVWQPHHYPELRSLGHVNHSALYVAFSLFSIIGLRVTAQEKWLGPEVVLFLLVSPMFLYFASSWVATCSAIVIISCWLILFYDKRKILLGAVFLIIPATLLILRNWAEIYFLFDMRAGFYRSAWLLGHETLMGYGIGEYGKYVTSELLDSLIPVEQRFAYRTSNHGHSLFNTVIVERGWLGIFCVYGFFVVNLLPKARSLDSGSVGKNFSLYLSFVTIVAGLWQTTFHLEHGALVTIMFGLSHFLSEPNDL